MVAWLCLQYILLQFITALPILHFIPRAKDFTNYYAPFPLQNKQFRPWEVCSLEDLWCLPLPDAFYTSMYLDIIAVLHYNKHDDVHTYVSKGCVSSK